MSSSTKLSLGVLFSGGKDSNFALYKAKKYGHNIKCLISMKSKNLESYMFQTPGNDFVKMQADSMGIPLIHYETSGVKEDELNDLKDAIKVSIDKYKIDGIVTGAIKSAYQASRIQKICDELNIECFNPLWQIDEIDFMKELIKEGFKVQIIGVFSYPLTQKYIGKILDENLLSQFIEYNKKFSLSVAGEGGELETFIVDSPLFSNKLEVIGKSNMDSENSGILEIEKVEVIKK